MTTIEKADLEARLSDAFRDGEVTARELRLTADEAREAQTWASVTPMPCGGGDKRWYEVCPKGAMKHE